MTIPRATYRLQLSGTFGFRQAAEIAPYLARLGISHVYLSPFFKARPGSTHGYDITDHAELNPELGDEADYRAMIAAYEHHGIGRILDFVPNHMGVGGSDNPIWLDVLEWGRLSRYAAWFDIDWDAQGGKLLAPVLGSQYGIELRNGKLVLKFEADGSFAIWAYGEHKLPICPSTYPIILGRGSQQLDSISDLFNDLPQWMPLIAERANTVKAELAALASGNEALRRGILACVDELNGNWRELGRLIEAQSWRVAFYRVAGDEINYRRFFNINDLAGLRMEFAPVFVEAHVRVFQMLRDGEIDGLRIDHIDGLFDPKAYLTALKAHATAPFFLVVEKLLAPHELLRDDWPADGTTGYDFLNLALGVLVDSSAEAAITNFYRDFTGDAEDFETQARSCKQRIMENEMASELARLARSAKQLARQSPMTSDLTSALLHRAIKEIVAAFPVYRTYLDFSGVPADADRRDAGWAIARARRADPEAHDSAYDFLQNVLLAEISRPPTEELSRSAALRFAMQLQQFSGPVMAKGVEDTAFYRFNRLIGLNEVGGSPQIFGTAPSVFHKSNQSRAEHWPHAMLATATHDTKRGEDARARLAVLSEMPEEWQRNVTIWSRLLRARRGDVEGTAPPDRRDEYMFYQMLLGVWPMEMLRTAAPDALENLLARLRPALEKSLREGKRRSSWTRPDVEYEAAMQAFAADALRPEPNSFLASFLPFVERVARLGAQNSLLQIAAKFTAPGTPDVYQGAELWDFSLVDPDNRRPVDFASRAPALDEIAERLKNRETRADAFAALSENWTDGRVKLATVALLLALRRDDPQLFLEGDYRPLTVEGPQADWAFGYVRTFEQRALAIILARFPAHREAEPNWEARVQLPEGVWRSVLDEKLVDSAQPVRKLIGAAPFVALRLERPHPIPLP